MRPTEFYGEASIIPASKRKVSSANTGLGFSANKEREQRLSHFLCKPLSRRRMGTPSGVFCNGKKETDTRERGQADTNPGVAGAEQCWSTENIQPLLKEAMGEFLKNGLDAELVIESSRL